VDSVSLLQKIDAQAEKRGLTQDVLIEVNIGGEAAKSGVAPEALDTLLQTVGTLSHVRVRGLMAIPPIAEAPGANHDYFSAMHQLFVDIGAKKYDNVSMDFLSMGMSDDFEDEIACGANMVRVGSSIFGARNYTQK
jgi:pyridoxal phosphate enzyme (YggS family)